jgi:hypothetical protein
MEIGLQELDESGYWLEMLIYSKIFDMEETRGLLREDDELMSIFVTCIKNVKDGHRR